MLSDAKVKIKGVSELSRVGLSVISWLVTVLVFSVAFWVRGGGGWEPESHGSVQLFCYGLLLAIFYSFPGWGLSLAAVLLVQDARGWRFVGLVAFGLVLGPLTDVAISCRLAPFHILYSWRAAAGFSTVALLLYALLLRYAAGAAEPDGR